MKPGFALALAVLLSIRSPALSKTAYAEALIDNVPHVKQRDDFCGEACVEMVLRKLGKKGDQNYVFNMAGLDPLQGRGCYSADLARALKRIGFNAGDVFFAVDAAHAVPEIEAQWKVLHADLLK